MAYKVVKAKQLIIYTSLRLTVKLMKKVREAARRDRRKPADWIRLQLERACKEASTERVRDVQHSK